MGCLIFLFMHLDFILKFKIPEKITIDATVRNRTADNKHKKCVLEMIHDIFRDTNIWLVYYQSF